MKHDARLPWLFVPAGTVWAWLAVREQHGNGRPWSFLISMLLPGVLMIGSGLVIWRRRPHNRCWWLLVAAGFAWYVGEFEHASNRDIALGAFAFGRWYDVFLGWALLAFPTGRLRRRHDRVLVVALAALVCLRSLSRLFLHVPPDVAGYGTQNRFLPISDERWWRMVEDVFGWGYSVTIVLIALSMADRWRRSSQPGRRMLSPALAGAVMLAAAVVYEYAVGWSAGVPRTEGLRIYYVVIWGHGAVAVALAFGFVRLHQTRSAVVDLVAELGHDAPPARLEESLGRALGDADLSLLPWSSAAGGYVDDRGRVVDLSVDEPNRAITEIERRGEPVAAIVHDPALLEDPGLVNAVIAAVRLTIDNEHLQAELQSQLAEVAASRARIVAAGDEERRRIERDLHDGAQQRLVAIALSLRLSEAGLREDTHPEVRAVLSRTVLDLREAIDELRALARGIHPAILDSGLGAALESVVNRSPFPVHLDLRLDGEPSRTVTATAYFAVSEALTNIAKHADAHEVTVRAIASDGMIHIDVTDDGVGGADAGDGSGLSGIRDRVATIGGSLRVHSPPGGGTRFEVDLPCVSS